MKRNTYKQKLLEELRKVPVTSVACRNAGINRSTFYRWRDGDITFKAEALEAMLHGRDEIVDLSKVKLIKGIQEGQPWAVLFALRHYDPEFKPIPRDPEKRPIWADEILSILNYTIKEMSKDFKKLEIPEMVIKEFVEEKEKEDEEEARNQESSGLG